MFKFERNLNLMQNVELPSLLNLQIKTIVQRSMTTEMKN